MSVDAILQELEKRLGELDEKAKQAVRLALELAGQGQPSEPQWQGENPPFEEMAKLDMMERSKIMWELEERNREWLERKCGELQARWLIVVDGQIMRYGPSLVYGWGDNELLQIAQRTGKMPLVFVHPCVFLIEETKWSATLYPGDAYPTIPIALVSDGQRLESVADFDTGANEIFVDALTAMKIVSFDPTDRWATRVHLGQTFIYCAKSLTVILRADDGTERPAQNVSILCILNWRQSPFVSVNPNRTSLVGRDICLRLQPKVSLDFSNRQTSISF